MPDRTYSFYEPEETAYEIEKNFPVGIYGTGHELRTNRSYRWNNELHLFKHYNILQYTLSGWGYYEYRCEDRRIRERVGPGKMFVASWDRPFEYFFDGKEPWDFLWITLKGSFSDQVARELREPNPIIELERNSLPVTFLENLQERLAGPYKIDHYALTSLAYEFLVQLLKEKSKSAGAEEDRFLLEARDYVVRNIRTANVGSLACHFGYGEKYFIDYFKRRASTTPNRFITMQRIKFASSLLMSTRKRIAIVAEEAGFSEDNYFSRVFKRYTGISPAEYREKNKDLVPVDEIIIL
jgi:AraC-like DNA-binding protein